MKKFFTLLCLAFVMSSWLGAQNFTLKMNSNRFLNHPFKMVKETDDLMKKRVVGKHSRNVNQLLENETDPDAQVILTEDFSKFTAGSESEPDKNKLDDVDGFMDDQYFNTPGWTGYEIFQAGGCAYVGFSEMYASTGMLITPILNLKGAVTIKLRVRSVDPKGDYFNYNIYVPALDEVTDVNYMFIGNEWTDVEFVTSLGAEASSIFFFTEQSEMYIDDITIVSSQLDVPELLEETQVSETGFTANWEAVADAELYDVFAYADHVVGEDGICVLAELDFANMQQGGTEQEPIVDDENMDLHVNDVCKSEFPGWYAYMPAYVNGMMAVSGQYAAYQQYGYLSSPEMDLSANDGLVDLTFRVKAPAGDRISVAMLSLTEFGYDFVDSKAYETTGEWQEVTVTLQGGNEFSSVQIVDGGSQVLLIDDVRMTQKLSAGEVKKLHFFLETTEKTSCEVVVPERYRGDKVGYAVRAVKNLWDYSEGFPIVIGAIESDFTEYRYVTLPTAIDEVSVLPSVQNGAAYDLQGRKVKKENLRKGSLYIQNGSVRMK